MPASVVTGYAVAGDPETGHWCDVCNLSSKVVFPVYVLGQTPLGVPVVMPIGRVGICADCGRQTKEGLIGE